MMLQDVSGRRLSDAASGAAPGLSQKVSAFHLNRNLQTPTLIQTQQPTCPSPPTGTSCAQPVSPSKVRIPFFTFSPSVPVLTNHRRYPRPHCSAVANPQRVPLQVIPPRIRPRRCPATRPRRRARPSGKCRARAPATRLGAPL